MNTENWQIRIIQLLSVIGMFLAYYLLLYHNGVLVGVCPASGIEDCGKVSGPGARYASIGPVPVALIGLIGYAVIFLAIWLKDWWAWLEENLAPLLLSLTGLALLFSLGLTALEIFVIHAICRYCVISAINILIMFILSLLFLRKSQQENASL